MKLVNPWGISGSKMNPWLRATVCVATGFIVGTFGIQVLDLLPKVIEAIAIILCLGGIAAYLIKISLWIRAEEKQMDIALSKLAQIEKADAKEHD